jgi:L-amino acid N-acyltransferase YncA
MKIRDAVAKDLPAIVEIYNSTIPSRAVSADTEPVSVEQRSPWFDEHEPSRRPIWVMESGEEIIGWSSLSDFYDRRPAYHATAEIGVYVREGYRGEGVGRRLVEEAIARGPKLGLKTLTAGAFGHTRPASDSSRGWVFGSGPIFQTSPNSMASREI